MTLESCTTMHHKKANKKRSKNTENTVLSDLFTYGVDGARTRDLPRVRRTLSRLSYHPI